MTQRSQVWLQSVLVVAFLPLAAACGDDAGSGKTSNNNPPLFDAGDDASDDVLTNDAGEDSGDADHPDVSDDTADGGDALCEPNPCTEANRTSCVVDDGAFSCECTAGFSEDEDGDCVAVELCEANTCSGRGDCSDSGGVVVCDCDDGWAEPNCSECDEDGGYHDDGAGGCTTDPCTPNPCTEPGTTVCSDDGGQAACSCSPGFHEEVTGCVEDTECLPTTCNDQGMCDDSGGSPVCSCNEGWDGASCDMCDIAGGYHDDGTGGCTMDPCLPNPCNEPNRGECIGSSDSYTCECDDGHHDEQGICVVDETCEVDTCSGNGACAVNGGIAECDCDDGFAGDDCGDCDTAGGYHDDGTGGCTMDPCLPNPCTDPLQTVCVDTGSGVQCDCDPGAHPDGNGGCTTDPCIPNVCAASNMACRDDGNGNPECYTPVCDDGNPCTDDELVQGECVNTDLDNVPCSTTECIDDQMCNMGSCEGGTTRTCDDANPCTDDYCDDALGCQAEADETNIPDDGIDCTVGTCDESGFATHTPMDSLCDDGLWCTGEEFCRVSQGGCVTENVPQPPLSPGPCLTYGDCREGTQDFEPLMQTPGSSCNDGVYCTTNDVCDDAGLCLGAVTASCDVPGGGPPACTTTTTFGGDIDIPTARVQGTITLDGGDLPAMSTSGGDIDFYLVARDTGRWHLIHRLDFDFIDFGQFSLENSGDYEEHVMPGVYDLLYERGLNTEPYVYTARDDDPYVNGVRILQQGVVIGAGVNTLDIDVVTASVSGTITLDGGTLPTMSTSGGDIDLYLVSQDTGRWHLIHRLDFDFIDFGQFSLENTGDYTENILPGTYDLLYERGLNTEPYVYTARDDDPYVNGVRYLQRDVVIGAGNNSLDIDVTTASVSGTITLDSGPLPTMSTSGGDIDFYLVSHDTGRWHLIHRLDFDFIDFGQFSLENTGDYTENILPGTYDLLYERGLNTDPYVYTARDDDPYVNGVRYLQRDVVIGAGNNSLDIDVTTASVSGTITLDGGVLPTMSTSGGDIDFYLVSHDTGRWHLIHRLDFDFIDFGQFSLENTGDYTENILPGTYDLLYERGLNTDPYVYTARDDDPYVNGVRYLQRDVVIGAGNNSLDIDVITASVSGTITLDGGALPTMSTSGGDIDFYLVSHDTGRWHLIHRLDFDFIDFGEFSLETSGDYIENILPGTYDLLYERGLNTAPYVYTARDDDAYVNGVRYLQHDVVIGAGNNSLDVDIPSGSVEGSITLRGQPLPDYSTSGGDIDLYLVAEDTGRWHLIHRLNFDFIDFGDFDLVTSGDYFENILPGTYHLLYERGLTTAPYVYTARDDDPYANGVRYLDVCVEVP